jgi:hypothetical protein
VEDILAGAGFLFDWKTLAAQPCRKFLAVYAGKIDNFLASPNICLDKLRLMFISRLRYGAPTWSRIVPYVTYSTAETMNAESQLVLPSEPQANRKKRPRKPKRTSLILSPTSKSLPNNSVMIERMIGGIQDVAQSLSAVSIVNQPTPNLTVDLTMKNLQAFEQSMAQLSKNPLHNKAPVMDLPNNLPISVHVTAPKPKTNRRRVRAAKVNPSAASGGIPDATHEYLRACLFGPTPLNQPQHLLVVIDLNGTLLFRPNRRNPTNFQMRPHAQNFLKYCVDTFTVVIWSSARPENVNAMCNTILTRDIRSRVTAIWGRDMFGLSKEDFDLRVQCYKRLSKLWQDPKIAGSHPAYHVGFRWNQTNTVLIDDSREKARTEPHNLIEVPEWLGDLNEQDDILPQVHDYLNHLSMHSNVSACLYNHPWRPTVF